MNQELIKEIEELKNLLKYYKGEPIRKEQIDEIIKNIENKVEESFGE